MANADFTVDIPISGSGGTGGTGGGRGRDKDKIQEITQLKKLNVGIKGLGRKLILTAGGIAGLGAIFQDVYRMLQPLVKILGLLFVVVFMPLMPLLMELAKKIGEFIFDVAEAGGGLKGLVKVLTENFDADEFIGLASILAGMLIISFGTGLAGVGWAALIFGIVILHGDTMAQGIIEGVGKFWSAVLAIVLIGTALLMLTVISMAFGGWAILLIALLFSVLITFWSTISQAFSDFWISVKEAWAITVAYVKGLGQWIAEGFKAMIQSIIDTISSWFSSVSGFVGNLLGFAAGGPVTGGQSYIVGEKGPELFTPRSSGTITPNDKLGGFGGVTVNINNPVIRDGSDITKLANEVSRVLQRQVNSRVSSNG